MFKFWDLQMAIDMVCEYWLCPMEIISIQWVGMSMSADESWG